MPKQRVAGKSFKFVQKGRFVEQANRMRQEAQLEKLKADIAATVKRAGMDVELDLVSDLSVRTQPPPAVEWWDVQLIGPDGGYGDFSVNSAHVEEHVTNLIQHPIPIQPPAELGPPPPKPLMLTKKERKKLRRQRRMEAQKEKQDKIRLGLLPPEQPKVKISNLMRVLGTEAVQDPTKVEALVRAQMKARQQKHAKYISENKLTKEQRRERTRLKLLENTHVVVETAVFRVRDLSRPQHRYKVDINAHQLNLTGVVVDHPGSCLVVAEGGNRGIKQYKKLMLRRIDWSEANLAGADGADEGGGGGAAAAGASAGAGAGASFSKPNECVLVWEGKIKKRLFQGFQVRKCPLERDVKELLEKAGCAHYWDAAKHYVVPEA
ncbi:pre-mRNA processing factor 3-domain-containing protein [Zopfochytrium polystomum]|nr:pre-mRNA processing factor 3-domain-containing protein [Zopfochytrium polystomum]